MKRTHNNGDLRLSNVNEHVDLIGWVSKKRNFGQLVFIDLRDRSGICQLVFDETMKESLKDVRNEYLLNVSGTVMKRQASNPDLKTGEIPAHMEQLLIYAALFCLEYKIKPGEIQFELRIYQTDDILICNPTAEDILPIMDKIISFDKVINNIKCGEV